MTGQLIEFPRAPWEQPQRPEHYQPKPHPFIAPAPPSIPSATTTPIIPTTAPAAPSVPPVDETGERELTAEERRELLDLYREHQMATRALDAVTERVEGIDQKIRALLGGAKFADEMPDGGRIQWTPPTRSKRLNKAAFKKAHPDVVNTYESLSERFKEYGEPSKGTLKIAPPKPATPAE